MYKISLVSFLCESDFQIVGVHCYMFLLLTDVSTVMFYVLVDV